MADLWAGPFGDSYTERNNNQPDRREFWKMILERCSPASVLEPGANRGFNLAAIKSIRTDIQLWACDVNRSALRILRRSVPGVNAVQGDLRTLPFRTGIADLAFTVGVLIHINPVDIPRCIGELTRCSKRWILIAEYDSSVTEEIEYRGVRGALWKAPYGQIAEQSAALRRVDSGFLTKEQGFDRVTWWLYEKGCDSTSPA